MSPAEELRAAADLLRRRAQYARESMDLLPGPDYPTVDAFHIALCRQFPTSRGMAEHIAGWTPELAEALASWLETEVVLCEKRGNSVEGHTFDALRVARQISGTAGDPS